MRKSRRVHDAATGAERLETASEIRWSQGCPSRPHLAGTVVDAEVAFQRGFLKGTPRPSNDVWPQSPAPIQQRRAARKSAARRSPPSRRNGGTRFAAIRASRSQSASWRGVVAATVSAPPWFFETLRHPAPRAINQAVRSGDAGHTVTLDIIAGRTKEDF